MQNDIKKNTSGAKPIGKDSWEIMKNELNGNVNLSELTFSMQFVDFSRFKKVSKITIPRSENNLGDYAYAFCPELKQIAITSEVENIGEHPMHYSPKLETIEVEENNNYFCSENGLLYSKDKSKLIRCPEGKSGKIVISSRTTTIDRFAFSGCRKITSIELPNGIDHIGEGAFQLCENLGNIKLPDNVLHIWKNTFYNCINLKEVILPKKLKDISEDAFFSCKKLKTITFPKYVESISDSFNDCDELSEFKCEEGAVKFRCEGNALYSIDGKILLLVPKAIVELNVGKETETISKYAVSSCTKLTKVSFPKSLKTIEEHAFLGDFSLKEITLPEELSLIQNDAFNSCVGIRTITSLNNIPPKASSSSFCFMPIDHIDLKIPKEALDTYKKDSTWGIFTNISSI